MALKLRAADGRAHVQRLLKKAGTKQTSPELRLGGEVLTPAQFGELVEKLDAWRSEMLAFVEGLDIILCPAAAGPALPLDAEVTPAAATYTRTYNLTGWPAAVVRAATSQEGLPLGIQIVGRPWSEHVVLAVAAYIESKTGGWQKPQGI